MKDIVLQERNLPMPNKLRFDECLKYLLEALDIRMSQLSKSINVDSSLISHWIHGKRIPPYHSHYIDQIADYLSKNIHNSYQMSMLDNLMDTYYCKNSKSEKIAEQIKILLLESQGYSMELRSKNNSQSFQPAPITISEGIPVSAKLIQGSEQIFKVSQDMIATAKTQVTYGNQTIYVTYTNSFYQNPHLESNFYTLRTELLSLIKNDWTIIFLLRIDNNINRIIHFIHYALPILKTGKMKIYYLNQYNIMMDREIYAISNIGILTCFPTDPNNQICCGFFFNEKNAIIAYIKYFKVLLKNHSKNLLKFYGTLSKQQYYEDLIQTKEYIGKQINYNCAFSMTLIPEQLYSRLLVKTELTTEEQATSLHYYKKQLSADIRNLKNELFINIFFSKALEQVIQSHYLLLYTANGVERVYLDTDELIEYLKGIISFISTYDNFKIALIYQQEHFQNLTDDIRLIIKDRKAVYLHALEPDNLEAETRMCIKEPTLIKAFMGYYTILWEQIPEINKEKADYINFLNSHIEMIQNKD